MAQDRLNSLAITAAHTNMLDVIDIDLQAVTQEFASLNHSRRKQYGCFFSQVGRRPSILKEELVNGYKYFNRGMCKIVFHSLLNHTITQ